MILTWPSALSSPAAWRIMYGKLRPEYREKSIDEVGIGAAVAVDHLEPALGEVAAVAAHRRQDVLLEDRRRHRPGRVQHHVVDRRLEDRRLAIRLADLRAGLPDRLAVADEAHAEAGDVDDHQVAVLVHLVQHPAAALEVQADLVDARLHRHVQLAQRRRADRPVGRQQVAMLEVAHGRFQRRVEEQRVGRARGGGRGGGGGGRGARRRSPARRPGRRSARGARAAAARARRPCRASVSRRPAAAASRRARRCRDTRTGRRGRRHTSSGRGAPARRWRARDPG